MKTGASFGQSVFRFPPEQRGTIRFLDCHRNLYRNMATCDCLRQQPSVAFVEQYMPMSSRRKRVNSERKFGWIFSQDGQLVVHLTVYRFLRHARPIRRIRCSHGGAVRSFNFNAGSFPHLDSRGDFILNEFVESFR